MAAPGLANRMRFLRQSEIRNMTLECTRVGGINMSQGVCDTPVPEAVQRAAQAAIAEGHNIYTRYDGIPELRHAIAKKLGRYNGLRFTGEGDVVVTSGSSSAFYGACLAVLDPGDEVVLFEPYYGYHTDTLTAVGAEAKYDWPAYARARHQHPHEPVRQSVHARRDRTARGDRGAP
jgi:aminotransferase